MTIFSVQSGTITQEFEIGDSCHSEQAIRSYRKYTHNKNYKFLKQCFAELYFATRDSTQIIKISICLANDALGKSTFTNNLNLYQKIAITNFVTSIVVHTQTEKQFLIKEVFRYWIETSKKIKALIEASTFDPEAAREAGLYVGLINKNS